MNVVFTAEAEKDLHAIGAYIVQNNPSRALTYIAELEKCCVELGQFAKAYPLLSSRPNSGIRRRTFGNYLIFYRVREFAVEILHVLHGAQHYERILFPDE
jgi:addiction module RelE/StbE family toxin